MGQGVGGFPLSGKGIHVCVWPREHHPDLALNRIPSSLDNSLLHSIETIIIDWSHQIRDVLSKDSAQALLDGLHPLPRVEFEFWDARLMNLQCIHEQVGRHFARQPGPRWPTGAPVSLVLPSQGPQHTFLVPSSALAAPGWAPSPEGWTESWGSSVLS